MKRRGVAVALLAGLWLVEGCAPGRAVDDLRGKILFYPWTHGATLSDTPEQVATIRGARVRSLREIEEFAGTLAQWVARTEPMDRLEIDADDFVLGQQVFFYYLASLEKPARATRLEIHVTRIDPDEAETFELRTPAEATMNRHAQSGGVLYSLADLAAGEYQLRVEVRDADRLAAAGTLRIDYRGGEAPAEGPLPS